MKEHPKKEVTIVKNSNNIDYCYIIMAIKAKKTSASDNYTGSFEVVTSEPKRAVFVPISGSVKQQAYPKFNFNEMFKW